MDARAKTINLLLYDGNLQGVISIEDSSWNSGEMYSAPRNSVQDLLSTDACKKYGVYLLLSHEKVYIGQSSDLAKRLSQHIIGKDWWESVVILTTKDDSLNHADIDYLESVLIDKAFSVDRLDCDNKRKGNPPKVDKFRGVFLGQYLDEALFLMQLIGISVFSGPKQSHQKKSAGTSTFTIDTLDARARLSFGKGAKTEAVEYLKDNGVDIGKHINYSVLQSNGQEFWINPRTKMLSYNWNLILNDNVHHELITLTIPAETFSMRSEDSEGLVPRVDKPELIDLLIARETLVDKRSGMDFSPYVFRRITY